MQRTIVKKHLLSRVLARSWSVFATKLPKLTHPAGYLLATTLLLSLSKSYLRKIGGDTPETVSLFICNCPTTPHYLGKYFTLEEFKKFRYLILSLSLQSKSCQLRCTTKQCLTRTSYSYNIKQEARLQ